MSLGAMSRLTSAFGTATEKSIDSVISASIRACRSVLVNDVVEVIKVRQTIIDHKHDCATQRVPATRHPCMPGTSCTRG
jgi:hypothetical protein